jgi:EmrB/QacA subfamily drug resistance transporter
MVELRLSSAAGRWALTATILGSGLAMLDATIVNVALPRIGRDLGATLEGLQWTLSGYTLSLAALILLGGALSDRYGRRRVFLVGVVWFALASGLCAVAPNIGWLVAARVLQGIGGALLTPGALALIQASFHPDDRARAVGAWSGLSGVAAAVGPFLGGWIIAGPGWRWAFLLNLPVAALVVAVTVRHMPESRDETAAAARARFDILGTALGALALAAITYGLIVAAEPGHGPIATACGVAGAGLAAGFVYVERHRAAPMLPLDVFASGQFVAVNVVTLVVYAALGGTFFLFTLQLQVVAGFSPLAAGAALLPVTLLMLLLSARAGGVAQRIGPRWPMTVGTALAAAGVLLMSRVGPGASYLTDVLPAATLFGLGLSATVAPLTATVLATADQRHAGIASGVNNAVARAAQLLAVAGLPVLVGLSGADYLVPARFGEGFRAAMYVCAAALAGGSLLSLLTIRDDALRPTPSRPRIHRPERTTHCAIDGTPIEVRSTG